MVNLSAVWDTTVGMGAAALRSFLRTMVLLLCLGVVLGTATFFWLMSGFHVASMREGVYCAILSVAVLLECLVVGLALAAKRALAMALIHAVRKQGLAQTTVRLLFQRLLGVSAEQPLGERGGVLAQAAERIPLAELEKRVNDTVGDLLGAEATTGGFTRWFRSRLRRKLLDTVRKGTLARFRAADAEHGGVDLIAVQAELESSIDEQLVHKLKSGVDLLTAAALVFLPLQVAVGNYVLCHFLHGPFLN